MTTVTNATKPRSHKCDFCSKLFLNATHLRKHINIHTGLKPHVCFICQASFSSPDQCRRHEQRHSGINLYKCRFCEKSLSSSTGRKKHEEIHMGAESMLQCWICGKEFRWRASLDTHLTIHSGIKAFSCGVCSREAIFPHIPTNDRTSVRTVMPVSSTSPLSTDICSPIQNKVRTYVKAVGNHLCKYVYFTLLTCE